MSNQKRDRCQLFDNQEKRKPSQPDMQGEGTIAGTRYAVSAWKRENQLVVSFAPPRDGSNKYPAEEFRGALSAGDKPDSGGVWSGDIQGAEASYSVKAFDKQGKSGTYLRLELALIEPE